MAHTEDGELEERFGRVDVLVNSAGGSFVTFAEMTEDLLGSRDGGREGAPEEVVGAVAYLASRRASYALGGVIEVNGGRTRLYFAPRETTAKGVYL